jgi:hypothetical protein
MYGEKKQGGEKMAVIRVNKSKDFTVMSNTHFREKEMSLKAKGLLSLMLSLPDDWDYSINGLCTLSKDGYESVMNALQELEKFGYLKRERSIDEKGRFAGYDYDIFEKPSTENPQTEKPIMEKPFTENPKQYNTNLPNTEEAKPKRIKKERKNVTAKNATYDEILSEIENDNLRETYLDFIKMRQLKKSPMTDRALRSLIKRVNELAPNSIDRQIKVLEQSILNNWQGVFPLKDENGVKNNAGVENDTKPKYQIGTLL